MEATTITISVTQEDINHGEQGGCETCPVALAFKRAVPDASDIDVSRHTIEFFHSSDPLGDGFCLNLPGRATGFIDDFDAGGVPAVEPFNFTLSLPLRLETPEAEEARIEASPVDVGEVWGAL